MFPRCRIALYKDNQFISVYCHFDGDNKPGGVGPTLRRYYSSQAHAERLMALGDLSSIGQHKACAYHRDRQQTWATCRPRISQSHEDLIHIARESDAVYLYLFTDNRWITCRL